MILVNGTGKKIGAHESDIKIALRGDTSIVLTKDKKLWIAYDEDNAEIDISLFDEPVEKYFIESEADFNEPIRKFLELLSDNY